MSWELLIDEPYASMQQSAFSTGVCLGVWVGGDGGGGGGVLALLTALC